MAGACVLIWGFALKGVRTASREATPLRGFNAELDIALAHQTADAWVGGALLVLGFIGQLVSALGWDPSGPGALSVGLLIAAGLVGASLLFLGRVLRPSRAPEHLYWRLADDDPNLWTRILNLYRPDLGEPRENETLAEYAERLLGRVAGPS